MSKSYRKILSIDGGGVRGLIPAIVIDEIETRTGKRVHELFDLIVGTSAGGLLAVGLSLSDARKGKLPYSAKRLVRFYEEKSKKIFYKRWDFGVFSDFLGDEKYDEKPLEQILEKLLGNAELKDTKPHIIVTAYDIEKRRPYFFKTRKAILHNKRNHLLRDVARATSAAPTYFEPLKLNKKRWKCNEKRRVLIDGGVFANNPAMVGFSEAKSNHVEEKDIVICSIGTGMNDLKYPYSIVKDWSSMSWGKRLPYIMMDGMSDSTDYHLRSLLPDNTKGNSQRYFRFDVRLTEGMDDLDNATRTNLRALRQKAHEIIEQADSEIELLCGLLSPRTDCSENHDNSQD